MTVSMLIQKRSKLGERIFPGRRRGGLANGIFRHLPSAALPGNGKAIEANSVSGEFGS